MRKLILVKHAKPVLDPALPPAKWRLSEEGKMGSLKLAYKLALYNPSVIVSSEEPKAFETAENVCEILKVPHESERSLHEHERSSEKFMGREEFQSKMREFFENPDRLVFGSETANGAKARFTKAVHGIIDGSLSETIVVVAHGTVITLFASQYAEIEPFSFWKKLDLPSFAVFSLPDLELIETVESIE